MTDERMLEQEYRSFKRQAAPDLWGRIEGNLRDHPESESSIRRGSEKRDRRRALWTPVYGTVAAAAVLCVAVYAGMHSGAGKMDTGGMTTIETIAEAMEGAQAGAGERAGEAAQAKSAVQSEEDMWAERHMEVETSADLVCSGTVMAVLTPETGGESGRQVYEILIGTVYYHGDQSADMSGETIDVKGSAREDSTALETGKAYRFSLVQKDGVWEVLDADAE